MSLLESLSRTLLLMRTDLVAEVSDTELLDALTNVTVVLHADAAALATNSGQTALVTAALTMARSGHEVWVDAEEVEMLGPQLPLFGTTLLHALAEAGADLLPTRSIALGVPLHADLAVFIGRSEQPGRARRCIALNASDWGAQMASEPSNWSGGDWPLGAIAAAVLAASETFKIAMRNLSGHAASRSYFNDLYAPASHADFMLAPPGTPKTASLPHFDFVSGGAIANAALFGLARLPGVAGTGRVLDDDRSALSNLNRNALLRRSALDLFKVEDLARLTGDLVLAPEPLRYLPGMPLMSNVLIGVDDIASRWAAQAAGPRWLGVGATEGFSVLVSSHAPGQPCVGCLHPVAATPDGPIPTAAFISLLSGLLLVARWQRALGPEGGSLVDQQHFANALRPEGWSLGAMPLSGHAACPVGCSASRSRKAA